MSDPGKQFPWIRVFGTLGWIVAGLIIGSLKIEPSIYTFLIAAGVSGCTRDYSVLYYLIRRQKEKQLPLHQEALGTESFVLFKSKPYLIFFIAAILVCIPLSFYYGFANGFLNELNIDKAAAKMTDGGNFQKRYLSWQYHSCLIALELKKCC
jgi:uncharacterized membrane protein YjjB (DUF3815 family)